MLGDSEVFWLPSKNGMHVYLYVHVCICIYVCMYMLYYTHNAYM